MFAGLDMWGDRCSFSFTSAAVTVGRGIKDFLLSCAYGVDSSPVLLYLFCFQHPLSKEKRYNLRRLCIFCLPFRSPVCDLSHHLRLDICKIHLGLLLELGSTGDLHFHPAFNLWSLFRFKISGGVPGKKSNSLLSLCHPGFCHRPVPGVCGSKGLSVTSPHRFGDRHKISHPDAPSDFDNICRIAYRIYFPLYLDV